jgi:hypothetical protein
MEKVKNEDKPLRRFATIDFETDPFKHGRYPKAFAVGFYDGVCYQSKWGEENAVIQWAIRKVAGFPGIVYAHNGGRFDFLGILFKKSGETIWGERVHCIAGRIVKMQFGEAELRDSYAILPAPLRAYDKGEISYTLLEAKVREKHKRKILDYLARDCRSLYDLVAAFLALHGTSPLTAASAAMKYCRKLGTKVETLNESTDARFRRFYSGGLVLARKPGIHHGKFSIFDIKSAYPYAMVHSHSAGKDFDFQRAPREISPHGFYLVRGTARECFLRRSREGNMFGGKGEFYVTGWELLAARKHFKGTIIFGEVPKLTTDFKPFVNHFFEQKQHSESRGDKAGRLIAKIMLNALYGKFAQRGDRFRDYVIMPVDEPICEPWEEECVWEEYGFAVWGKPSDHGNFYNVATAASITGFVRAMLMKAIYEYDPYYCDTDSIITDGKWGEIRGNGELGSWGKEAEGDLLYIAGKKLYALRILQDIAPCSKSASEKGYHWDGKRAWKIASKGCRLNPEEMKALCQGKTIEYRNEAPSFSLLNSPFFIKRNIRATCPGLVKTTKAKTK